GPPHPLGASRASQRRGGARELPPHRGRAAAGRGRLPAPVGGGAGGGRRLHDPPGRPRRSTGHPGRRRAGPAGPAGAV
ncbi:MAG: hypothetical protein AVDCRST_MAG48-3324, partial [uncultured Friedmanniella sp.]